MTPDSLNIVKAGTPCISSISACANRPSASRPHTDFFFTGANRGATLDALIYAITQDEGIVKVTGEVGSGKTMLCRVLLERLPADVETLYLANPSLSRDEILRRHRRRTGSSPRRRRHASLIRTLQEPWSSATPPAGGSSS